MTAEEIFQKSGEFLHKSNLKSIKKIEFIIKENEICLYWF